MTQQFLSGTWRFRKAGETKWYPASVPGSVHTDLMANQLIPDPFYRKNFAEIQWIEECNWEYETDFIIDPDLLSCDSIELVAEGLDTFASLFLNGKKILECNNMFYPRIKDVKELLVEGKNHLRIDFFSPIEKVSPAFDALPFEYPANNDTGKKRVSSLVRRSPYTFGWDWCPRMVGCSIWKNIYIRGWNSFFLSDIWIRTLHIAEEAAKLEAHIGIRAFQNERAFISLWNDDQLIASHELKLRRGDLQHSIPFLIEDPRLWWPNGTGKPYLYNFRIKIENTDRKSEEKKISYGIRNVELVQDPLVDGTSFHFRINGVPLFMKGANCVPLDFFPHRVKTEQYEQLIEAARLSNFNMIRAWGGAFYENEAFYNFCDEKGILVWQDFMFACGMYPADPGYLKSVEGEIHYQVKRLRNHPSLLLWCGNNEVLEGYETWGWKEKLGPDFSKIAWNEYEKLFHELIPKALGELDPDRPYWPSSPSSAGNNRPSLKSGDYHYWDIIKGDIPVEQFAENIGRFMSEYGFKGYPELKTIHAYTEEKDRTPRSEVMEAHQGWPTGLDVVERNLTRNYPPARDFKSWVYLTQIAQAHAIRIAIEAHRSAKPHCMGSLYWQLNDCWPTASWSGIDYYGRWKAMQYQVRRSFDPLLISVSCNEKKIHVRIISDRLQSLKGILTLRLLDFFGKTYKTEEISFQIQPQSSAIVFTGKKIDWLRDLEAGSVLLAAEIREKHYALSKTQFYFVPPKKLDLPAPNIQMKVYSTQLFAKIILTTDRFAKDVCITCSDNEVWFPDNYFDLLPGEEKEILVDIKSQQDSGNLKFEILSLGDLCSTV